ncbi:hypothetical protein TW95_gp0474 [Pandoravirus inopinatum]|uniref:Uncharacterized protein n=1 Tax=Pandoravirus inopinatum TaxID=1605721 RepID=A0A0B5IWY1_9VIRU|nr:hypothetical protein TW95_gp0474 [Pandoravirus inopinatum]AJF97208.1 hypothetical protein [Pandoravirus inopinatum]
MDLLCGGARTDEAEGPLALLLGLLSASCQTQPTLFHWKCLFSWQFLCPDFWGAHAQGRSGFVLVAPTPSVGFLFLTDKERAVDSSHATHSNLAPGCYGIALMAELFGAVRAPWGRGMVLEKPCLVGRHYTEARRKGRRDAVKEPILYFFFNH